MKTKRVVFWLVLIFTVAVFAGSAFAAKTLTKDQKTTTKGNGVFRVGSTVTW